MCKPFYNIPMKGEAYGQNSSLQGNPLISLVTYFYLQTTHIHSLFLAFQVFFLFSLKCWLTFIDSSLHYFFWKWVLLFWGIHSISYLVHLSFSANSQQSLKFLPYRSVYYNEKYQWNIFKFLYATCQSNKKNLMLLFLQKPLILRNKNELKDGSFCSSLTANTWALVFNW